jgi:nucleoside-diphosphate-sugar epimerase
MTGAGGFVGQALTRVLRARGYEVIALARGEPSQADGGYEAAAPEGDVLIHLGEVSDRRIANEMGAAYEQSALARLGALLAWKYQSVVYASSAVLYGDRAASPRSVGDPVYANDVYTRIKLASEQMVLERGGGVVRLSNLYGNGMARGTVLGTILGQLRQSGFLTVQTTSPVRDFLWIDDAARALCRLIETRASGIFNVGCGTGVSIHELASIALAESGETGRPVVGTQPDAEPSVLVLDIAATTAAIGWKPEVSLREGLRRMINTTSEQHE